LSNDSFGSELYRFKLSIYVERKTPNKMICFSFLIQTRAILCIDPYKEHEVVSIQKENTHHIQFWSMESGTQFFFKNKKYSMKKCEHT